MRFITALAALFLINSAHAQNEPAAELDQRVISIVLNDHPTLSYSDSVFKSAYETTKIQLDAILLNHVKAESRSIFGSSLGFIPGQLIVKIINAGDLTIANNIDGVTTGNAEIDALLAKFEATKLEPLVESAGLYILEYDLQENPSYVGAQLKKLDTIEYAEINATIGGNSKSISKVTPFLFMINIGWGDCPAGCIQNNRTYIEAYANGETAFVGRVGDKLEQAELERFFVD